MEKLVLQVVLVVLSAGISAADPPNGLYIAEDTTGTPVPGYTTRPEAVPTTADRGDIKHQVPVNTGLVAGVTVGATAFVGIAVAAVYAYMRRKKTTGDKSTGTERTHYVNGQFLDDEQRARTNQEVPDRNRPIPTAPCDSSDVYLEPGVPIDDHDYICLDNRDNAFSNNDPNYVNQQPSHRYVNASETGVGRDSVVYEDTIVPRRNREERATVNSMGYTTKPEEAKTTLKIANARPPKNTDSFSNPAVPPTPTNIDALYAKPDKKRKQKKMSSPDDPSYQDVIPTGAQHQYATVNDDLPPNSSVQQDPNPYGSIQNDPQYAVVHKVVIIAATTAGATFLLVLAVTITFVIIRRRSKAREKQEASVRLSVMDGHLHPTMGGTANQPFSGNTNVDELYAKPDKKKIKREHPQQHKLNPDDPSYQDVIPTGAQHQYATVQDEPRAYTAVRDEHNLYDSIQEDQQYATVQKGRKHDPNVATNPLYALIAGAAGGGAALLLTIFGVVAFCIVRKRSSAPKKNTSHSAAINLHEVGAGTGDFRNSSRQPNDENVDALYAKPDKKRRNQPQQPKYTADPDDPSYQDVMPTGAHHQYATVQDERHPYTAVRDEPNLYDSIQDDQQYATVQKGRKHDPNVETNPLYGKGSVDNTAYNPGPLSNDKDRVPKCVGPPPSYSNSTFDRCVANQATGGCNCTDPAETCSFGDQLYYTCNHGIGLDFIIVCNYKDAVGNFFGFIILQDSREKFEACTGCIRFVGNETTPNETTGVLQVYFNTTWRTVCYTGIWTQLTIVDIACRMLGFNSHGSPAVQLAIHQLPPGVSIDAWTVNIEHTCSGTVTSLWDCDKTYSEPCWLTYAVGGINTTFPGLMSCQPPTTTISNPTTPGPDVTTHTEDCVGPPPSYNNSIYQDCVANQPTGGCNCNETGKTCIHGDQLYYKCDHGIDLDFIITCDRKDWDANLGFVSLPDSKDEFEACTGCIRLIGNETMPHETTGILQVYYNNKWGSVCQTATWNQPTVLDIACRMLGFNSRGSPAVQVAILNTTFPDLMSCQPPATTIPNPTTSGPDVATEGEPAQLQEMRQVGEASDERLSIEVKDGTSGTAANQTSTDPGCSQSTGEPSASEPSAQTDSPKRPGSAMTPIDS
uniref:SRCR domain-containing protein n=1 Tax=Branchiostoma floridae TaxID=7739 RepID=C3ZI36_BRAFL|eukprot:XP_002591767.1 hypothetical protein BRAFLDRAFT_83541 [Branchiostoma floridae]